LNNSRTTSHDIYGIEKWGKDLIVVLDNGEIGLKNPLNPAAAPISLPEILRDLEDRGVHVPMLLRVSSYLESEIRHINECVAEALERVA
jgi:arginine decarboxylase